MGIQLGMQVTAISDIDGKCLTQVKNILKLTVKEMKFSLGDARIIDETIQWFDAFMSACANVQKMEAKKNLPTGQNQPQKTEGLGSLKIKDFNPGSIPIKKSGSKAKKTTRKK